MLRTRSVVRFFKQMILLIYIHQMSSSVFADSVATSSVCTGEYLTLLPPHPKLGKMLIMGAFFRCFDPILTIVDEGIEWIYRFAITGSLIL
ncbi:hypothetical protein L1987_61360 [Smallanthus sonchifolius]|uniref:Uncharacterized protein n=1 Tax=Smallanthus sonchifolius TaxID=185202 RepID=A0ACB9DAH8_9ASTR|nr:hypothetical protein L1987_61360 [Smallanthus sonchifolius]